MRFWPRSERRSESADYTERAIAAIEASATGTNPDPQALAAVEAAASHVRVRICGSSPHTGRMAALDPRKLLGIMGRAYVLRGEAVFVIGADDAGLFLAPVAAWDIAGPADPRAWTYRCDMMAPGGSQVRVLPAAGVIHVRWHMRSGSAMGRTLALEACAPFGRGRGGG